MMTTINWIRNAFIAAILIVIYLLVIRWSDFQDRIIAERNSAPETTLSSTVSPTEVPAQALSSPSDVSTVSDTDVPETPAQQDTATPSVPQNKTTQSQLVQIQTDVLQVTIDTLGGDIVKVALPKFLAKLDSNEPFILLNRSESQIYVARSGLLGPNGTDAGGKGRPLFNVNNNFFELRQQQDQLVVDLTLTQSNINIVKRYTFNRNSYLINIDYIIENNSEQAWEANFYGQIKRDGHRPISDTGIGIRPFVGAAITTADTNYKKVQFDDLQKESLKESNLGGWLAMVQHYFISAWVPNPEQTNNYTLRKQKGQDIYLLEYVSEITQVAPHTQGQLSSQFYAGPKNLETLTQISDHLALTLDFGWLWFIGKPLFIALDHIHGWVNNWGIAIILLTVLVKLIFFYPSAMSFRSMAKMRKLQPMMQDLKEKYGEDRQRMSRELMDLYKREKVNPLGGCLPVLLQMPVFIALYWVLMESVELRHAPFFLWIEDLSVKDPYFILPLIMGVTMFIQQKLSPAPPDPMQAKVMQMMPIVFTAFMAFFPSGLVLYWVVNNSLSITQQYIITKQIEKGST